MASRTLEDWLKITQSQHRLEIDLTLDRVRTVATRLGLLKPNGVVVTVGGTNGKGSTVTLLEQCWLAAGYRVGAFTSPWLYCFNELIRVQGKPVTDALLIAAFTQIHAARGEITLTQFEFNTLAALLIFRDAGLDVLILEVGLGGRLDAVNCIDADVAVITSIALDHMDRLGTTREAIGFEKAGIFRQGQLVVCGDFSPPTTLLSVAQTLDTQLVCQNKQFGFLLTNQNQFDFWCEEITLRNLPVPKLALQNVATALTVVCLLQKKFLVSRAIIENVLKTIFVPGRIQVIEEPIIKILDVSHNPAAAELLASYLTKNKIKQKTRAVFSMLADKDIVATINTLRDVIDEWFIAPLPTTILRAATKNKLEESFINANIKNTQFFETIPDAVQNAENNSVSGDRIIIFGSFYTVSTAMGIIKNP